MQVFKFRLLKRSDRRRTSETSPWDVEIVLNSCVNDFKWRSGFVERNCHMIFVTGTTRPARQDTKEVIQSARRPVFTLFPASLGRCSEQKHSPPPESEPRRAGLIPAPSRASSWTQCWCSASTCPSFWRVSTVSWGKSCDRWRVNTATSHHATRVFPVTLKFPSRHHWKENS